ncbi:MAG TPA: GNAT family N-acetyltransferase [Solirubrobacterales bacterium]|nr:GNAT family N-acetyltransferase [Solirubrobacterales bacterium]
MARFSDPEPLGPDHSLSGFDCGVDSLSVWLPKHARAAAASGSARTYVVEDAEQGRVVGYSALCAASVSRREANPRTRRGMPRHPIPAVLLTRLAVDRSVQGHGLGAFLLRDAMVRALGAAAEVGIRLVLVHALNESARNFYLHHGFEPSQTDPMNLQLLIKDIVTTIGEVRP